MLQTTNPVRACIVFSKSQIESLIPPFPSPTGTLQIGDHPQSGMCQASCSDTRGHLLESEGSTQVRRMQSGHLLPLAASQPASTGVNHSQGAPQQHVSNAAGVMLLHLERMRNLGWDKTWRDVTRAVFASNHKITNAPLADQDVFNAVLARHPE